MKGLQKKKLASAESADLIELAREVSLNVFELRRLAENLRTCDLGEVDLKGLDSSKNKMTKELPKLLQQEASLLESLGKMMLRAANEECDEASDSVYLHVDRLYELLLDTASMAMENVDFSVDKQQDYGHRVCDQVEEICVLLPATDSSEYNMELEEHISSIELLVEALERLFKAELKTMENTKEAVSAAMEDYRKACKGAAKDKVATFDGISLW